MILVELFSKEDCHLCDIAMNVLTDIQRVYPFELRIIKIQEGDENYEEFKERIPVVYFNKEFAFQYRVPEQELIKKLRIASPTIQQ
ncbi:MAG: glutaredoxin family protein [Ignavibacteria bacterium]|nr:glutaredoxin family protein [Ignavibacteria bacterium]MBI3765139.1 glutaredoxin family protein [Ignavibacteriales bacterium]